MSKSDLTWHHYKALAALEPEDQRDWFNRAVEKKMSARELAKALKKPPTNTPKNDPLSRLAYLRQVSVKELTAGIVREYLARPEVVSEMAEADAKWAAAEFTTPPDQPEVDEQASESARMDAAWAAAAEFTPPAIPGKPSTESERMDAEWERINNASND